MFSTKAKFNEQLLGWSRVAKFIIHAYLANPSWLRRRWLPSADCGLHYQIGSLCSLSEGKSLAPQYDVVFCAKNFLSTFKDAEKKGAVVLGLRNIMSLGEMEKALEAKGLLD